MMRKLIDMFTVPPNTWNARGEPYFWEDLRLYFLKEDKLLPVTFDAFVIELHHAFEEITDHSIDERDWFFIEKYAHGGMSSGRIDPVGWRYGGAIFNFLQDIFRRITDAEKCSSTKQSALANFIANTSSGASLTSSPDDITRLFEQWRTCKSDKPDWGLTWFLANEICKRFYASHGIVPSIIKKEGMGYYGILFSESLCAVHKLPQQLGRLTMTGNTENWLSGSSGDHKYKSEELCKTGTATSALISGAINHLRLSAVPRASHLSCRHKRWGDSYILCFEIAACIALRYDNEYVSILNSPADIQRHLFKYDPKHTIKEHPGGFLFRTSSAEALLIGDGRLVHPYESNMWEAYMLGKTPFELSNKIIELLDL